MEITRKDLKNIIEEELSQVLKESAWEDLPKGYGGVHPTDEDEIEKAKKDFISYGGNPKFRSIVVKNLIDALGEETAQEFIEKVEVSSINTKIERLANTPEEKEAILYWWKNRNSRAYKSVGKKLTDMFGEERADLIKNTLLKRSLDEDQGVVQEKLMLKKGKEGWWKYSQLVAEAYKNAPAFDESVVPLYNKMGKWLEKTFGRISTRVKIEFVKEHPYESAQQMRERVEKEGVMYVSTSDAEHPVWTGKQGLIWNTMFRAWHDWEGHIEKGKAFALQGEIAAYNAHAKTVPRDCVPILFTEVVGQICCFYQNGKKNCEQKATILPGFDYINVGVVEGYDIVDKQLVKRGGDV